MKVHPFTFLRRRILVRYHPSAYLLAAQFASLMLHAFYDGTTAGRALLGAVSALILAASVWVVTRSGGFRWVAWGLVVPAFGLSLLSAFVPGTGLVVLSALLEAALYFYSAATLIAYMMEDRRVTADELFAAGATFTLLAWGFAYLYLVCQIWVPGSFTGMLHPEAPRSFMELLFFSFTNLSATGLGDILPLAPAARVLTMLEQFAGVAYIAVVVSRLIGLTIKGGSGERA